MKESDQLMESLGESIGYAKEYISQQKELLRLELAEKIALITSLLVNALVFFLLGLLVFSIGSISLGFYLAEELGSNAKGFLVLFAIYVGVFLILFLFRRQLITNPILERILHILHNNS